MTIIDDARNLIGQGKLGEALELYRAMTEDVIQISRYNRAKKNQGLGFLSYQEYSQEINQITHWVLEGLSELEKKSPKPSNYKDSDIKIKQEEMHQIVKIKECIRSTARKNPQANEEFQDLLKKFIEYSLEKDLTPNFDISGRRLKSLDMELENAMIYYREKTLDKKEEYIEEMSKLLSEAAPSWENLGIAYNLAFEHGLRNEKVKADINEKIDSKNLRIEIAEILEQYKP